jgi:hypothetical protein
VYDSASVVSAGGETPFVVRLNAENAFHAFVVRGEARDHVLGSRRGDTITAPTLTPSPRARFGQNWTTL